MATPASPENFDKAALSGPASFNPARLATEAQNLFTPVAQNFNKFLTDVHNSLGSAIQQAQKSVMDSIPPSLFLRQGLFQPPSEDGLRKIFLQQPAGSAIQEKIGSVPPKVTDLSVVVTTNPSADLVNEANNSFSADFLVKKNGTIEILDRNIDSSVNANHKLKIAVEADNDHATERTKEQQDSLNLLSGWVATRYMMENGKFSGSIDDNGLISSDVKKAFGAKDPQDQLPADYMRPQVDQLNQLSSANQASMSSGDAGNYFPSGDSRYQQGNRQVRAMENVAAGYTAAGDKEALAQPYTTVRNCAERGFGAGRYTMTYDMFLRWLFDLDLGPDGAVEARQQEFLKKDKDHSMCISLIERLHKQHKITDEMYKALTAPGFQTFLAKLQAGGTLTPEVASGLKSDIEKYLSPATQEKITYDILDGFTKESQAKKGYVDPGEIIMALQLGHLPTEKEAAELKKYSEQTENANQMSLKHLQHPNDAINLNSWKTIPITSGFGMRKHPILGITREHDGIDMARPFGTSVSAAADGKVVFAGWKGGYGNCVDIDHGVDASGRDIITRYGHLASFNVQKGQEINVKSIIGKEGQTGLATGPHLHFEVQVDGKPQNPLEFLKKGVLESPMS